MFFQSETLALTGDPDKMDPTTLKALAAASLTVNFSRNLISIPGGHGRIHIKSPTENPGLLHQVPTLQAVAVTRIETPCALCRWSCGPGVSACWSPGLRMPAAQWTLETSCGGTQGTGGDT